ncbi:UDP-4-amino-4,6-dideoxy-N-acetyl-beta-L-altrosamine transaminase [Thalassotalea euphylliae]|uniref:UDP-4-amino-4, 6-dideoxy-N-acetyl-beta-L-altrosamine transaminase n=1 Tax=Thalassotalea euphylliae TaxID=1655234 RepID=UPI0036345661
MIPYSTQLIEQDDVQSVVDALTGSHLTQGQIVKNFEALIAKATDSQHAVAVNSATSALHCAFHAIGLQPGDEVITTPISFVATANMIIACGAIPVFCDVKDDGNIDESLIPALISDNTKAIVSVDFAGKPVNYEALRNIANEHKLFFVSDASHALGSSVEHVPVGALADITIFSFHAIKPITTGEGGAAVTQSSALAEKMRLFSSHGMQKQSFWQADMVDFGHNYRITEFASALGINQLKKLKRFISRREEIANYFDKAFSGQSYFTPVKLNPGTQSARHLYPVLLNEKLSAKRDSVISTLHEKGILVQVHYRPIYQNTYYQNLGYSALPNAEKFYQAELSIPCQQKMTNEDMVFVADSVLAVAKELSEVDG